MPHLQLLLNSDLNSSLFTFIINDDDYADDLHHDHDDYADDLHHDHDHDAYADGEIDDLNFLPRSTLTSCPHLSMCRDVENKCCSPRCSPMAEPS